VAASHPGDLILVGPGRYQESVRVTTPHVTIRGTERNDVVLDGGHRLDAGIIVEADGVAVENLTLRSYQLDGVRVGTAMPMGDTAVGAVAPPGTDAPTGEPPIGFRVTYVTIADSGGAGVRVAGASGGLLDHVTASDLAGAGVAVSGCQPCDLVVIDSLLQLSRVGFDLDGAAGVVLARSTIRRNRSGIRIGAAPSEPAGFQAQVSIVGLTVTDNSNPDAPGPSGQPIGDGIVVVGSHVSVLRNRVTAHDHAGIWLTAAGSARASAIQVTGNAFSGNLIDLLAGAVDADMASAGTCFADNAASTSSPETLAGELPCGAGDLAMVWPPVPAPDVSAPGRDFRLLPLPAPQPTMPGSPDAPVVPVADQPVVDVDAIPLPAP
jgi:hypothetical protein